MAYIDKIQRIMDILNDDTLNTTENSYLFTKALTDIIDISKNLAVTELTILQLKSRIDHNSLNAEDVDFGLFQDDYDDQIAKAKDCIITLNKVCEDCQIPPFYKHNMYDERAIMEFINTFIHAIIRSYYKEKEHIDDIDLTKQRDMEEMER